MQPEAAPAAAAAHPPPPPAVRVHLIPCEPAGARLVLAAVEEQAQLRLGVQQDGTVAAAISLRCRQRIIGGMLEAVRLRLEQLEDGTVAALLTVTEEESIDSAPSGPSDTSSSSSACCPAAPAAPAAPEEAPADPAGPSLLQLRHAELLQENARLQGLVRQYLDGISKASRKSFQEAGAQLGEAAEQRYLLALQQLGRLLAQRREVAAAAQAALASEVARAAAAQAKANAQRSAFLQLVTDVGAACTAAAAAGQSRAALPPAMLQSFLAQHPAKAEEGRVLRAACDRLAHQLSAAEAQLKAGDQLSGEGLHLVDYEQLRIEAASLAAKREARVAEVDKLRAKLAAAVQITAHVREKLHCAEREHAELEARAAQREAAMAAARTELAAARTARDRLRRERDSLADDWSIVSDRRCLQDMVAQRERLATLQAEAAALQARCAALQGQARGS